MEQEQRHLCAWHVVSTGYTKFVHSASAGNFLINIW